MANPKFPNPPVHWYLLQEETASNDATIDLTAGDWTNYSMLVIQLYDVIPGTDGQHLFMRMSDDGGSTYEADAADYAWVVHMARPGGGHGVRDDSEDSKIELTYGSAGSATGEAINGIIECYNPGGTATGYRAVKGRLNVMQSAGAFECLETGGWMLTATAYDGIRFLFASGNIASGTFKLWGVT
jgi:hypothetical protein